MISPRDRSRLIVSSYWRKQAAPRFFRLPEVATAPQGYHEEGFAKPEAVDLSQGWLSLRRSDFLLRQKRCLLRRKKFWLRRLDPPSRRKRVFLRQESSSCAILAP
jgi:hypothetical protein